MKRAVWKKATCDKCGEEMLTKRAWGIATLCRECIDLMKAEMLADDGDGPNPAAVALGSIRSERKAAAAKENGRKGGRPIGAKDNQPRQRRKKIVDTLSR